MVFNVPTINLVINVSVKTEKKGGRWGEEGTRSRLQKTGRVCKPVVEIHVLNVSG